MESDLGYLDSFIDRVFWQTVDAAFLVQLQRKKDFFHGVPAWPSGVFLFPNRCKNRKKRPFYWRLAKRLAWFEQINAGSTTFGVLHKDKPTRYCILIV
jgi:hypothetical protein